MHILQNIATRSESNSCTYYIILLLKWVKIHDMLMLRVTSLNYREETNACDKSISSH